MPIAGTVATLTKQGCFDADVMNALNNNSNIDSFIAGTFPAAGGNAASTVPFGNYTTAGTTVTILPAGAPAGLYRLTIYAVITTTFTGATVVQHVVGWTDDQGAHTSAALALSALTAGTFLSSVVVLRSTGTAAITVLEQGTVSNATAGAMGLYVACERIL